MGEVKLTDKERMLLEIAATDHAGGWWPDFSKSHPKNQPVLLELRERGLITFTPSNSRVLITEAGLSAISKKEGEDGR